MSAENNPEVLSTSLHHMLYYTYSLAFVRVWVEGMLVGALGVPPLAGDT